MDWVKDPSSLKKLRKPLDLLGPMELVSEAPRVLKHFMDEKSKYGCGNCHFWDYPVKMDWLKLSQKLLLS